MGCFGFFLTVFFLFKKENICNISHLTFCDLKTESLNSTRCWKFWRRTSHSVLTGLVNCLFWSSLCCIYKKTHTHTHKQPFFAAGVCKMACALKKTRCQHRFNTSILSLTHACLTHIHTHTQTSFISALVCLSFN